MEEHLPLRQILSYLFPSEGTDSVYFASRCIPGPRPETSTEQASDPALQLLLRPPPGFQAGARVVWGLHRDPLASPHNRPPFRGLRARTPFPPGGLVGRVGRPCGRVTATAGFWTRGQRVWALGTRAATAVRGLVLGSWNRRASRPPVQPLSDTSRVFNTDF